jgi:5,10-methylenetetrahydromethanopterin reductase
VTPASEGRPATPPPSLRGSIRVNNDLSTTQLVKLAQAAEAAGFDQIWVSHDLFLRSAPVLLGVLARETSRIRIGSGILNPYSQHPVELAMAAATLQEASQGRFLLGIGAGAADFLGWAGIPRDHPLTCVRRTVAAVRALLGGGRPADEPGVGRPWQREGFLRFSVDPPPIYVGAMSPRMLALAGEIADGVIALLYPPERYRSVVAQVTSGTARAGKQPEDLDLPACVWCSVDEDPERARAPMAEKVAYYGPSMASSQLGDLGLRPSEFLPLRRALDGGDRDRVHREVTWNMLSLGIVGTPDDVVSRCRPLVQAGARHLSFGPPLGPDVVSATELLGREVLARLRSGT